MDITFGAVVAYPFGVLAVLAGLGLLAVSPIAGVALLLAGLLALPVVRRVLKSRLGLGFSRGATVGLVLLLSIVAAIAVVGAALSGGGAAPGSGVPNVSMEAASASPPNPMTTLDVRWNARAQAAADPSTGDIGTYRAEDGQKFLVTRMQITNNGDSDIDLTPQLFRVASEGAEYEYQNLFGSSAGGLSQVSLRPGGSSDGWVVFSIPNETTEGELVVNQDAYFDDNISVAFEHDPSMPINVSA
jgi:hypothetical protein